MKWHTILSDKRLGKSITPNQEYDRTAFQKDVDRIVFSSAFRRLQDKTQVFPLAKNDYVRTRLTHSLEVSSVGRSLGNIVGKHITTGYHLTHITAEDFGSIVAAACLSHDIGNPPFGHFGEEAIRDFFVSHSVGQEILNQITQEQQQDVLHFEGNAQGFRILTQLQNPDIYGGLQLTHTTLATFTKYPCTRKYVNIEQIARKKNGLLQSDLPIFKEVADNLGLIQYDDCAWARHPLVFLVEAADDICYAIIDIEDAHQLKQISFDQAYRLLEPLSPNADKAVLGSISSNSDKISYLRAKAIGNLVHEAGELFMANESNILVGNYHHAIADNIKSAKSLKQLTDFAAANIYNSGMAVEIEMAGHKILTELLAMFCDMANHIAQEQHHKIKAKAKHHMLSHLLPTRFIGENRQFDTCAYQRTLKIIDFISGMTDSYAVSLYKKLSGISIEL